MFAKTSIVAMLAAAAGLAAALPTNAPAGTPTERDLASRTVTQTGVTHSVVAGRAGLHFDPDNVVAEVGDVVEFHFLPANHSVAQSSFFEPCIPLGSGDGFFSGFLPTASGQNADVFQIVVQDTRPIWYYSATGAECQDGMAGVINQNFNSRFTLSAYKNNAAWTTTEVPPVVQGGAVIPNPNPLSGY